MEKKVQKKKAAENSMIEDDKATESLVPQQGTVGNLCGEIVVYQPDSNTHIQVRIKDETIWLTQQQMVILFKSSKSNVSEHLKNIFSEGELDSFSTVREFRTVQKEGNRLITRKMIYYNLDVIISLGFRVNSKRGILFRQWANNVLKEYLLNGFSISSRLNDLEKRVTKTEKQIEFFVKTSLPPTQGVFYDGQIFDAYLFVTELIKKASQRVILIDNYVDATVLTMMDKRNPDCRATIYTCKISQQLQLDLAKHNTQYQPIEIREFNKAHDRFLIIDEEVYHIGASLKDLGKKWFAFSLLRDTTPEELLSKIQHPEGKG